MAQQLACDKTGAEMANAVERETTASTHGTFRQWPPVRPSSQTVPSPSGQGTNGWYRAGFRVGRLLRKVLCARPARSVSHSPSVPPTPAPPALVPDQDCRQQDNRLMAPPRRSRLVRLVQRGVSLGEEICAMVGPETLTGPRGIPFLLGGVRLVGLILGGASGPALAIELARLTCDLLSADRANMRPEVPLVRALLI